MKRKRTFSLPVIEPDLKEHTNSQTAVPNQLSRYPASLKEFVPLEDNSLLLKAIESDLPLVKKKKIINQLIKLGADLNIKNKHGDNALYIAYNKGCYDIVNVLIKANAYLDISCVVGRSILWYAIESDELFKCYIHSKNAFSLIDKNGGPLLQLLISNYDVDKVEISLKAGADVNYQNSYGNTPLHLASSFNSDTIKIVKLLCYYGANPFLKNNYGQTAGDNCTDQEVRELLKAAEDNYQSQIENEIKAAKDILNTVFYCAKTNLKLKLNSISENKPLPRLMPDIWQLIVNQQDPDEKLSNESKRSITSVAVNEDAILKYKTAGCSFIEKIISSKQQMDYRTIVLRERNNATKSVIQ